jgi:hypothetical protein
VIVAGAVSARAPLGVRSQPVSAQRIWFAPNTGSIDSLGLFERPEEWPRTRAIVTVFKFYQGHAQRTPWSGLGPNSYDALVRAGAFRQLKSWGIRIAMEVGSVKEGWCQDEPDGMTLSSASAIDAVQRVEAAGGTVEYLAQDEPWTSGSAPVCGGPALEPTADKVAAWMSAVQQRFPLIKIGLIEAHPFVSVEKIERILDLMQERGRPPAFLHLDVDWHALNPDDFVRNVPRLHAAARAHKIPFGVIVWGYNGDADSLFARDAAEMTNLLTAAFGSWDEMPEQIVFQSWAESRTGLRITPSNLPEDRAYTHTNNVLDLFRRLRGATGPAVGAARARK